MLCAAVTARRKLRAVLSVTDGLKRGWADLDDFLAARTIRSVDSPEICGNDVQGKGRHRPVPGEYPICTHNGCSDNLNVS